MNPLFLIFIALPALEIFLLIKIGGQIGALITIFLIFFTALIGIYFAKLEGIKTIKSGMVNLYQNKLPIEEMLSGAAIAFSAVLLIVPGFLTDLIGFFLLIPLTRKILISYFVKIDKKKYKKQNLKTLDGEIVEEENKKNEL